MDCFPYILSVKLPLSSAKASYVSCQSILLRIVSLYNLPAKLCKTFCAFALVTLFFKFADTSADEKVESCQALKTEEVKVVSLEA